jgi:hypothetical protein
VSDDAGAFDAEVSSRSRGHATRSAIVAFADDALRAPES